MRIANAMAADYALALSWTLRLVMAEQTDYETSFPRTPRASHTFAHHRCMQVSRRCADDE